MLKQMAQGQLAAIPKNLCIEILAPACVGLPTVDDAAGRAVLEDALRILVCKEIPIRNTDCLMKYLGAVRKNYKEDRGDSGGTQSTGLQEKNKVVAGRAGA